MGAGAITLPPVERGEKARGKNTAAGGTVERSVDAPDDSDAPDASDVGGRTKLVYGRNCRGAGVGAGAITQLPVER